MTDHTPGPWHRGSSYTVLDKRDNLIADAAGRSTQPVEVGDANARLIAAAPALLAAAEEIARHQCDEYGCPFVNEGSICAVEILRPAIAQAHR